MVYGDATELAQIINVKTAWKLHPAPRGEMAQGVEKELCVSTAVRLATEIW